MPISYLDYIFAQSQQHPSLRDLCRFLGQAQTTDPCRIVCLEFRVVEGSLLRSIHEISDLATSLRYWSSADEIASGKVSGRVLIIEDLNNNVVGALGSTFDIDPLFFSYHIDHPTFNSFEPSSTISLPSKAYSQNFVTLRYSRAIEFMDIGFSRTLMTTSNVTRKVKILPSNSKRHIGFRQHCCSVLFMITKSGTWLGLILVDAINTNNYIASSGKEYTIQSRPFQGGFEDFMSPKTYSQCQSSDPTALAHLKRSSLLEDLLFYWGDASPSVFKADHPTLLSIANYPLRIVAGEWKVYVEVMSSSIKLHEYSTAITAGTNILTHLDSDLRSLETWGRRQMQNVAKLRHIIRFLNFHMASEIEPGEYAALVEDYEHIITMIDTYGNRMASMIPVVASLVQIADTRRSLKEAENVTRLTNLALFFIPLTFVTGLFSMNNDISAQGMKRYFSVAIPFLVAVFVLQAGKHTDITGLQLVGGVRREAT
ncbi:hypothetical protein DL95DRAFT_413755 [Leptodontidium sp. 2 PMI_412]|nr:hypothetical protein DL95DRAFT_413755 [Leptodontidium sp. 2 PMI_412]